MVHAEGFQGRFGTTAAPDLPPSCHRGPRGIHPLLHNPTLYDHLTLRRTQTAQSLVGNLTVGGVAPVVLHFTNQKPWHGREPGRLGHQFLCSAADLRRRSVAAGMT